MVVYKNMQQQKIQQFSSQLREFEMIRIDSFEEIDSLSMTKLEEISQSIGQEYATNRQSISKAFNFKIEKEIIQLQNSIYIILGKIQPSKVNLLLAIDKISETIDLCQDHYETQTNPKMYEKIKSQCHLIKQLKANIEQIKKILLLRESQLSMIIYLQQNRNDYPLQKLQTQFLHIYNEIKDYIIPIDELQTPINSYMLEPLLEMELEYLLQYKKLIEKLNILASKQHNSIIKSKILAKQELQEMNEQIKNIKIINSKLTTIAEIFPYACIKSKQDLFTIKRDHPRWKIIEYYEVIKTKSFGKPKIIEESFVNLKDNLNLLNATMNIINKDKDRSFKNPLNWKHMIESAHKVLKCTLSSTIAKNQAEILISQPDKGLTKQIWNLPEKKQFKAFIELTLPSIAFSKQVYIPRICKQFCDKNLKGQQCPVPSLLIDSKEYQKKISDQVDYKEGISLRINCDYELNFRKNKQQQEKKQYNFWNQITSIRDHIGNQFEKIKSKWSKKKSGPQTIIFHIHGGGFISMSSFIHQAYTRVWSKELNVPVVSVDYGKAPEHPFPEGLFDCLEAYLWTLYIFRQVYECEPRKIILVGDSAGGNLVASLTNLLITWKLQKPNGIVLVYPALNLNLHCYTPSLLNSLNDIILPHTFLKICKESYLKDCHSERDPLISPIYTSDDILKQYPKTIMFVGDKDPFHDDCCRFAERINSLKNGNANLTVFEEFPHGFLQFDLKTHPHQYCRQATKLVQNALRELINSQLNI